ncbi:MAG: ADP-ribosylglycohydrolase family protein [Bacteroidales bacterium]|nr:ADP-ribosylglycohydrolase family protein [Bacteroidales bacterium]
MKKYSFIIFAAVAVLLYGCARNAAKPETAPSQVTMTKERLMDKIKGGWAGQTIGCTYGGPTEFVYSTMINDNIPITWPDHRIQWYYDHAPGLYDDVYMDLTFVDVFEKEGLDAPVESFAKAFSSAAYPLWHANQNARYNIQQGMMPPESGFWMNNPHSDDIDFQIEADYAGLMAPGMPNAATFYTDAIGHMMNYGDGWYGGVYVAAMYSLAFISDDIEYIVTEALKTIPEESKYYQCMADVIRWHKQYPDNWEITWALVERKWGFDIGCPDGVLGTTNIDAVINSAYIIMGLLYGGGDFYKTIDVSTRCGKDSDCNPASSGGILGVVLGYSKIPEYWMKNLYEVEDRNLAYTDISLNKAYQMSFNQALQVIERNGGTVSGDEVTISCQKPEKVRLEQGFEGHWPISRQNLGILADLFGEKTFTGNGIVLRYAMPMDKSGYVGKVEVSIDGVVDRTVSLPSSTNQRSLELYFKYGLPVGEHKISLNVLNPDRQHPIEVHSMIVYSDKPEPVLHQY